MRGLLQKSGLTRQGLKPELDPQGRTNADEAVRPAYRGRCGCLVGELRPSE